MALTWEEQRRLAKEANRKETLKVVKKETRGFSSEVAARYAEDAERIGTTGAFSSKSTDNGK